MKKRNEIQSEEISVVVQGPISSYTAVCCKSIRRYLPFAEIILSTWEGSEVEDIDYDILELNKDPGNFIFVLPEKMDNGSSLYSMNVNRQIVSTLNGLKRVSRKYACKIRSDMILTGTGFIKQFLLYHAEIKKPYSEILKHRVVTLPAANPRRYFKYPFYLCDWFYFGLTSDLISIWDQSLVCEFNGPVEDNRFLMYKNFSNEQYIWLSFLKKVMKVDISNGFELTPILLEISEQSFSNCCIFSTASEVGIKNLKVGISGYGAKPYFSNAGLYTKNEWKRIYNQYGYGKVGFIYNPFEELLFWIVKKVRYLKKSRFKYIYTGIWRCYHYIFDKLQRR